MTVISMKPIPLASVGNYLPDVEDSQPVKNYLKEFTKLSESKALELIEKLQGLNSIKLRESHFVKLLTMYHVTPKTCIKSAMMSR
jgi:DNA-directed RNA polymerase subunit F